MRDDVMSDSEHWREIDMTPNFEGKVALVTGAASGIGRATAMAFAEQGAHVIVADHNEEHGCSTMRDIREHGNSAIFVYADMLNPDDIRAMVKKCVEIFGGLDFAFNNAGIEGEQGTTAESSEENWSRVIGVNLNGVWHCMKQELPHMLARGGGVIVNCSSVAGLKGFRGIPAYVASKHAVIGLTKAAALEYATKNIRVNAVCPGVIQTPMISRFTQGDPEAEAVLVAQEPIGRVGTSGEVAATVLWLCSDQASFITGHSLVVDGGMMAG